MSVSLRPDHFDEGDICQVVRDGAGPDPRVVQDIADEAQEVVLAPADAVDVLELVVVEVAMDADLEDLGVAIGGYRQVVVPPACSVKGLWLWPGNVDAYTERRATHFDPSIGPHAMTGALFIAGAVLLVGGAELLVRGSSRLAVTAGISPLVVGLTVVAFGTGAPELAVTVGSTWSGESDVALGNVIGSNIANILLILGLSALVAPLVVAQQLVRLDVPLLVGASALTLLLSLDGSIGRWDGLLLFALIVVYTVFLVRQSRREERGVAQEYEDAYGKPAQRGGWLMNSGLVLLGLVLLVVGASWLVSAAVGAAEALGVSQLVIGLTVVAVGTSLPEVATSVLATLRGNRDIAVGNVVGSSLFNLLAVLGIGGLLAPAGINVPPGALTFDLPVMIATAVAALPIFFTGYCIQRWEGAVFLGYYAAFTVYLVLDAVDHGAADEFGTAMVWFVLPLTFLTLAVITVRAVRERKSGDGS